MSNTRGLLAIESSLRDLFLSQNGISLIDKSELLGTKPDVIGEKNGELYLGEITVSGFLMSKGRNFHIGGTKKLADSFLKLFILKNLLSEINQELSRNFPKIHICFIYPASSAFMKALGYREQIFKLGYLEKYPIEIDKDMEQKLIEVLTFAKDEMKH